MINPLTTAFLSTARVAILLACSTLLYPALSQARNGDDWVLVQRFEAQNKLAKAGDASAMYEVARMYERGRGTEPDMQRAIQWYERAVSKGQNNARAHLGVLFFEGQGVQRDLKKAISLIQPAAAAGNPTAEYYLGQMYEHGQGLRRDPNEAIHWYKKAAENGNYLAVARLQALEREPPAATQKAKSVATAPRNSESPARVLLQTVMNAKWVRNGRPTGYLPSANSTCSEKPSGVIACQSGEQQRNTGDAVITYVTESSLSGFTNTDQFMVKYYNNVHKVTPVARPSLDGEDSAPRAPPNIKLGKQSMIHVLNCEMQSIDTLVCVKDNNRTDTYSRAK